MTIKLSTTESVHFPNQKKSKDGNFYTPSLFVWLIKCFQHVFLFLKTWKKLQISPQSQVAGKWNCIKNISFMKLFRNDKEEGIGWQKMNFAE